MEQSYCVRIETLGALAKKGRRLSARIHFLDISLWVDINESVSHTHTRAQVELFNLSSSNILQSLTGTILASGYLINYMLSLLLY